MSHVHPDVNDLGSEAEKTASDLVPGACYGPEAVSYALKQLGVAPEEGITSFVHQF